MAIYKPGKRDKHGANPARRDAVMVLNITAMVDMFTVLTVFLLQNYATTNQILPLDESVNLPQAHETKELKPSTVVVLTNEGVSLGNEKLADFRTVKEQQDWMIKPLAEKIEQLIKDGDARKASLGNKIRDAVSQAKNPNGTPSSEPDDYRKVTVQADKSIDFLTVKKVMYTVTEAGMQEINFAVIKKPNENGG
jgi:biopolymer transport protein ExbD